MPRFPEEEIKRLKREISIERLCSYYGITLKPQGKNRVAHCPWHKDDTASFVVTPDKNLWHCMGACNTGGDVFTLVMKTEKVSFRHAAQILQELSGTLPTESEARPQKRGLKHSILVKSESSLSDTALLNHIIDFYHRSFLNDPGAMKYLEKRRCLTPQAVKRFKIGYANRTLCYRVPATTSSGKRLKSKLQSIGIYRQSGHEHLSGSVVFPIMDTEGNPVQMYGRKITTRLRKGTPEHLYLEKPLKGIWNYEGVLHQKEWILCEAIIDALTLWSNGFENVITSYGKNNFTQDHLDLIRESSPNKVIIAYDNDDTGNKASEALAKQLVLEGVNVHRALVPYGKDINGY
ncbi:MAG: toprim domain-containing protein, partial [Deltaproteobacteria bacterium]|nr:toprim domain-containing protein [Deltaproteobacteria bacterium]